MSLLRRARTPALAVTVLLVASFVIVGGIATGQSTNTYTGCLKGNGELAKVAIGTSPTQACSPSETQVSWNEQGPPGPQGDQGVTGAQGDTGPAGADGADGSVWFKGPSNPTNDLGADGDFFMNLTSGQVFHKVSNNWVVGPNLAGPEGPEGPPGPQGPEGPPADTTDLETRIASLEAPTSGAVSCSRFEVVGTALVPPPDDPDGEPVEHQIYGCQMWIPHGATVTRFTAALADVDPVFPAFCGLARNDITGDSGETGMAVTPETTGTAFPVTWEVLSTTSITEPVIDNTRYSYSVNCVGRDFARRGVILDYTLP